MRVPYDDLWDALRRALAALGFAADRADLCARLFADTTRDGVYSHGVNRFPRFVGMIRAGLVDVAATPVRVAAHGALERWDGRRGPGNFNAHACMAAAVARARESGLGGVALANTNHWMRGGTYGWQAADAGCVGVCWTNTMPNLPPWGTSEPRLGNNPLVFAVPRPGGAHVVLDMAMSQFSYGALASYRERGESLPVPGGFDASGELTRDPGAIEASGRPLPIGYWKGAGLALMLDLVGALLSGGPGTQGVPRTPETETGLSQVFLAFDASALGTPDEADRIVERIVHDLHAPTAAGERARYPGERTLETRRRNLAEGVPVEPSIWRFIHDI